MSVSGAVEKERRAKVNEGQYASLAADCDRHSRESTGPKRLPQDQFPLGDSRSHKAGEPQEGDTRTLQEG